MGRDGSLAGNQPHSPAAGHVYAKTGSGIAGSSSGGPLTVHKALAGFIELPSGRWLTFAQFMTAESTRERAMTLAGQAQEAMAEIATAVYEEVR
jgi:D-alanyl-D-alanine carboxypeptidase/D-alanyl-D-alanine-endopeptidase (penicillin-binding protein 4)